MISFVYFDVGGVAIRDSSHTTMWNQVALDLGIPQSRLPEWKVFNQKYAYSFCIDRDIDSILPELASTFSLQIPPSYSMLENLVDRFSPNPSIVPAMQFAQQRTRVGLLTDMFPRMFTMLEQKNLLPSIQWDCVIDSSQVRVRKPEKEIFTIAQNHAGVPADQILFIDNQQNNLDAAKACGWNTLHYDSTQYEESGKRVLLSLQELL